MIGNRQEKRRYKRRLGIGEKGDGGMRRMKFSTRAAKGDLDVIKSKCPHCHHHKIFGTTDGNFKCCKCQKEINL